MGMYLSKSKYCDGVTCPKILWLKKNKPELFDASVMKQSVLETGNKVGDLAMGLFGEYVEVTTIDDNGKLNVSKMIERTNEELSKGTENICEASFSYNGLYCAVDILKNHGNNNVEIYEVKSSKEVKDINIDDASYQNYVLTNLGYNVNKVHIVHINKKYVRHGEIDLNELFVIEEVTEKVKAKYDEVCNNIAYFEQYLQQTEEPERPLSKNCFKPYDCGFFKHCSAHLATPNVFDISGKIGDKKYDLVNATDGSFLQALSKLRLNPAQRLQVETEINDLPPTIVEREIKDFLDQLSYPIYFLDFETCQFAIPEYDNSSPYEQIVFQYSLHYIEEEGGELKHTEYLAYPGKDPRRELAEALCRDIPTNVCVLAYNMEFEKGRIKTLAKLYPDLSDHLMNIHDNILDLMIPFSKKSYYTRAMQGSHSIKFVLPALFPDDPSLDYHNLEQIHKGDEASRAFLEMATMSKEEVERCRKNLLKYCELDTYAMVKIWEKLIEVAK